MRIAKTAKIEENKVLFNKWAKTYDNSLFQFWMKGFHRAALEYIKKHSATEKKISILDISCGSGELLKELVKKGFKNIYGIDIAPKMLLAAKRKLASYAKLYEADVNKLPFKDKKFDYVLSTEAFHHYYDQKKALQEMKRVTKRKGRVIVADINFYFRPIHWLFEKLEPGCVKVNSAKQMRELFNRVGLKIEMQKRTFLFAVTTIGIVE